MGDYFSNNFQIFCKLVIYSVLFLMLFVNFVLSFRASFFSQTEFGVVSEKNKIELRIAFKNKLSKLNYSAYFLFNYFHLYINSFFVF